MGDAQGREPRRNLIVTSTPTTDTHPEEQEEAEPPVPSTTKQESQPLPSNTGGLVGYGTRPSPEGSNSMYGPTVAVYPQWQQISHQGVFMPQNTHSRFVQSSFQSPQGAFNMQNFQRSLPSQHSQQQQQ